MVDILEPASFPSPSEMYSLVLSFCLVLASSHSSEVQSQAPCVTPVCSAVQLPWKPLEFCVSRLREDMADPSAILYSFLLSLHIHPFPVCFCSPRRGSFPSLPIRDSDRHIQAGNAAVSGSL